MNQEKKSSFSGQDPKVILLGLFIFTLYATLGFGTLMVIARLLWEALKYGWSWGGVF